MLEVLKGMKVGDTVELYKMLPGVTDERVELTLNGTKKNNYMVAMSFMGVPIKTAVFYDYKGELIEVKQCQQKK